MLQVNAHRPIARGTSYRDRISYLQPQVGLPIQAHLISVNRRTIRNTYFYIKRKYFEILFQKIFEIKSNMLEIFSEQNQIFQNIFWQPNQMPRNIFSEQNQMFQNIFSQTYQNFKDNVSEYFSRIFSIQIKCFFDRRYKSNVIEYCFGIVF